MLSPRLLVAAVALSGCAAPGALDAPADHPAHLGAPTATLVLAADALPSVAPPEVPAVLRSEGAPSHAAHGHATPAPAPSPTDPTPLTEALDAYLALHDALAADRLDREAATAFAAAFDVLAEVPPPGDPHFWHMRAEPVGAVRAASVSLAEADEMDAARAAFGALSAPFASLVEAHGLPEGVSLVRHTCGMAEVAEGGVWLQRPGTVENPFFGAAMPTCGRPDAHENHDDHSGHGDHGTHDHGADGEEAEASL